MSEKIQKFKFKQGLPQEFEIIDFNLLFNKFSKEIRNPHRTDFYQILWFQQGSPIHIVDFNPIKVKSGSFLFINKNSVQIFDSKIPFLGKAILFTDNFYCKTEADTKYLRSSFLFNDLLSTTQISISNTILETIIQHLEIEADKEKDDYQSDIIRNDLRNLLLHAERERIKQGSVDIKRDANLEYALHLKELIEDHFVFNKSVSFYASTMHISTKRLNQTTSRIFGKSPKSIIDDRVLLEAKRLLVHTSDSVKEIAFELGFKEPTNFIKYFKKHTGSTPFEFRKKYI